MKKKEFRGSHDIITSARNELQGDAFSDLPFKESHECKDNCHTVINGKIINSFFGNFQSGETYLQKITRRKALIEDIRSMRKSLSNGNKTCTILSTKYFDLVIRYKNLDTEIKELVASYD